MTSFPGKEEPFGGPDDYILYLDPLQTAISGTDFDWTLRPKTALTWGCSNINYP